MSHLVFNHRMFEGLVVAEESPVSGFDVAPEKDVDVQEGISDQDHANEFDQSAAQHSFCRRRFFVIHFFKPL